MIKWKSRSAEAFRSTEGSISVEAAILLPGLLALVLLMVGLIQAASIELALQAAVDESGRTVTAYWSPIRSAYGSVKSQAGETRAAQWAQATADHLQAAREKWSGAEDWALQYEDLLPEPMAGLLRWETEQHRRLEDSARQGAGEAAHRVVDPLLCRALEPMVRHYANGRLLNKERLQVSSVQLPSLEAGGDAQFQLTVRYEWRLPVPFWYPKVVFVRQTSQRAWVGEDG